MQHTPFIHRHAARVQGFMLIEVLVSILIFSIGVLALVGLQAKMTHAQTSSKIRTDAAFLANELIGLMWSDLPNLSNYSEAQCASTSRCKDWKTKVTQALPGGVGKIDTLNPATGEVRLIITWTQSSDGTHTYTTTTYVKSS